MNDHKRRKRKQEKQSRRRERLRRQRKHALRGAAEGPARRTATFSMYGTGGEVEYICVAVHEGRKLLTHRFFEAKDYPGHERMLKEAMAFARASGSEQVVIAKDLLEPERCSCGDRTVRITTPPTNADCLGPPDGAGCAEVNGHPTLRSGRIPGLSRDDTTPSPSEAVRSSEDAHPQATPACHTGAAHEHAHEWVVFSTALEEGWLMLQCVGCGLHGAVEDPAREEWTEAYHAPSRPYRWHDGARVVVKGHLSGDQLYVVRAVDGTKCECYAQRRVLEPLGYERVPVEVTRPAVALTDHDRHELQMLAGVAVEGALCSTFFPVYLKCFEEDTGLTHGEAVREVARRIEAIDRMGLHCSPSVVSRTLAQIVNSTPTAKGI